MEIRPDPMLVPEPRLLFTFEKTYLTPARLVHFLGVLLAFAPLYALLAPRIGRIVGYLTQLGRNSLAVFSMGSILSLIGQLVRFQTGGGLLIDMLVAGSGLFGLGFTAWFVEWRTRSRSSKSARVSTGTPPCAALRPGRPQAGPGLARFRAAPLLAVLAAAGRRGSSPPMPARASPASRRNAASRARSSTRRPSSGPSRRRSPRTAPSRSWRSAAARPRAPRPPIRPSSRRRWSTRCRRSTW